jgi:hypothetical protein
MKIRIAQRCGAPTVPCYTRVSYGAVVCNHDL